MFIIQKRFSFEASHQLPNHDGKCARLHGHSWKGMVSISGPDSAIQTAGPKRGMLADFGDLGKAIDRVVDGYLDHRHLNDSLNMHSPTSELVAQWLCGWIKGWLEESKLLGRPDRGCKLDFVEIEETCTSRAIYRPDPT